MAIGMNGKISIIIPEDLKKISRRKLIIRFVMLTAVYMIEALLFVLFYEKFMSVEQSYIMLNAFGMIVLPPALIILPIMKDRSWAGEIYDYRLSELAAYSSKIAHPISYLGRKEVVCMKLRSGSEYFDREYQCYPNTEDPPADVYCRPGSYAVHVFGTKFPTVLPEKKGGKSICVVCGLINVESLDRCDRCGHTLIKHKQ